VVSAVWLLAISACAALASWLAVLLIRRLAVRWGMMDVPNERSSHSRAMPLGGGLAIVGVNVAAWFFVGFVLRLMTWQHALVFIIGGLLVAGVSLLDDLGHVSYRIRLVVHSLVALLLVLGYTYWDTVNVPLLGTLVLGIPGAILTIVWIVGLTNAYNFMDGLDGMLGGQAVAAGLGWVALGWIENQPLLMALGALLAASSLGFLVHNWHPARIFMGDVGSTFLGYSFAVVPVIAARSDPKLALAGVLLVWPAIFDSSFTVLRRLRLHQNIFAGHRTFLFHRLVAAGWSQSSAALLYTALPVLGAVLACTWAKSNRPIHSAMALVLVSSCSGLWLLVRQQEHRRASRLSAIKNLLLDAGHWASKEMANLEDLAERLIRFEMSSLAWQAIVSGLWDGVDRRAGEGPRRLHDLRDYPRRGGSRGISPGRRVGDQAQPGAKEPVPAYAVKHA
jgi:UDP-GlcNAc:undecaprenyl-phosphate/decaprenyl-phosphate GlcNAc-1-phosphate transferase